MSCATELMRNTELGKLSLVSFKCYLIVYNIIHYMLCYAKGYAFSISFHKGYITHSLVTITKKFSFFIVRHEVSMDSFDLGSDGWYRKRSSSHLWPQVKRRLLLS